MSERQPTTIGLSATELQAIVDEFEPIAIPRDGEPTLDLVPVGPFEFSRGELKTMAAAVAVHPTPPDSIQLALADDGSYSATWTNATDPPTVSTLLIRRAD